MARRNPMVSAIAALADRLAAMGDHQAVRQMRSEVESVRRQAEGLDSVNIKRRPVDTPAAHTMRVAKRARAFDKQVTASVQRASQAYRAAIRDVEGRITERVNLKPDAFASEIRTAFRALDDEARHELILTLIEENRGPELAAIVDAPSVLTGISDDRKRRYKEAAIQKHAAEELAEQELVNNAFNEMCAASRAATRLVRDFTDPGKLAAIEREDAEARAADEAFDKSIDKAE